MASAISYETLSDIAFGRLIADIVSGALPPGAKLRTEELKTRYGMGASPLREALAGLAAQGFVTTESHRGFRVALASREDLEEITRIREMIEVDALRRSIRTGGEDWEIGVISAFTRLKMVASRRRKDAHLDDPDVARAHKALHRALIAACGSPRLLQLHDILYEQSQRYRHLTFKSLQDSDDFIGRHEPLIEAALARDAGAAADALRAHLRLLMAAVYPAENDRARPAAGRPGGARKRNSRPKRITGNGHRRIRRSG